MVNRDFGFPRADYKKSDYIDAYRNKVGTVVFVKNSNMANMPEPVNSADLKGRAAD